MDLTAKMTDFLKIMSDLSIKFENVQITFFFMVTLNIR